ncbi:restriction endonuclease subunit S [Lacticaseibacillus paracasei]|uniref:Type I restriction modification DNA specificity domain protein n=2 Tax=Lacticaseibacillus paracasei TaxID=1597 RepID=A0A8B3GSE6_LACPA|nr:restriction endonuclease subunit S [Lacticaseibacillus paracasei]RHX72780.1 restriction endonuclease subunit S [Lacticaseibacillus paracasei]RNE30656.1 Type I restriction modification DNA specificity domain protein [Lacticaseibacillus paracasei]WCZ19811.1 restriction endonuclease subunit S [Lacticaseibacillus paracasei]
MAEFGCLYSEVLLTRNAWEKRKFKDLVVRVNKTSDDSTIPSVEFEDIISKQGRLNKDVRLKINSKQGIYFEPQDVLFGKLRPYLQNWLFPSFYGRAVGDFWVLRANSSVLSEYLFVLIQSPRFQIVANISSGTKMPRSDWNTVSNTSFPIPVQSEQRKIWQLFNVLDNLIAATQHKIDALEQIKEKLSQNLFDQSWRFKEYSTPWKENKLKDIVSAYSGGTPSANIRTYYGGHIPFIRSAEIHSSTTALTLTQEGLQNSSAKLVKTGDILYALYGANSGDVDRSKINGAINQAILAMRPSKENDPNFILFQLMRMKDKIVSTYLQGGQGNLSGRLILALNLDMPESTLEQRTIGRLLQLLCELIGVNQSKYSQLELLKKSLLQNLFV